jgi:hypothetical protein
MPWLNSGCYSSAARVLCPRLVHVGFVADKVAFEPFFYEYFDFPCQISFHRLLHTHLSSESSTIGQIVAPVPCGLSRTPHQETKKNYGMKTWIGFIWLRVGSCWVFLWTQWILYKAERMWNIWEIGKHTHNIVTMHSAQTSYSPHYRQIRDPTSDTALTSGNNKHSYKDTRICI